jgi:hypothetical protein
MLAADVVGGGDEGRRSGDVEKTRRDGNRSKGTGERRKEKLREADEHEEKERR